MSPTIKGELNQKRPLESKVRGTRRGECFMQVRHIKTKHFLGSLDSVTVVFFKLGHLILGCYLMLLETPKSMYNRNKTLWLGNKVLSRGTPQVRWGPRVSFTWASGLRPLTTIVIPSHVQNDVASNHELLCIHNAMWPVYVWSFKPFLLCDGFTKYFLLK